MTDAEKIALLRETLAPFVYAFEDCTAAGKPVVVAVTFFRHAVAAMQATAPAADTEEPAGG